MKILIGKELDEYIRNNPPCPEWLIPHITINKKLLSNNKKDLTKHQKLVMSLLTVVLTPIAISILIFLENEWIWAVISIVFLLVIWLILNMLRHIPLDPYREGLLVAGIVTKINPLTITTLSKMINPSEDNIEYGCKQIKLHKLPTHIRLGEYVPCAANLEVDYKTKKYCANYTAYPLVWATDIKEEIDNEIKRIGQDEWKLLTDIVKDMQREKISLAENQTAYFDTNGIFVGMYKDPNK